jgi:hypothetical protein
MDLRMSIHDAELNDIYIDKQEKLWRVIAICREPTVTVEEVVGQAPQPAPAYMNAAAQANVAYAPRPIELIRTRQTGGVSGAMWEGFKRIWRKEAPE